MSTGESYRFSMTTWSRMDEDQHKAEITESIGALDPRRVDYFLSDTPERRQRAAAWYADDGPQEDDCDPLLHLAEAEAMEAKGDAARALYSREMASHARRALHVRVVRDISEVPR